MKKVKALIQFKDLKEMKLRKIGDVFDVSNERFDEILAKGDWVEEIQELENLTVKEIKELLDKKEIDYPSDAKKAELIELLGD